MIETSLYFRNLSATSNSTMTGPERAVKLEHVKIARVDVCAGREVGKIAFAALASGGVSERCENMCS
jgi:hypothetical protein